MEDWEDWGQKRSCIQEEVLAAGQVGGRLLERSVVKQGEEEHHPFLLWEEAGMAVHSDSPAPFINQDPVQM
jgi:hypothetical protein